MKKIRVLVRFTAPKGETYLFSGMTSDDAETEECQYAMLMTKACETAKAFHPGEPFYAMRGVDVTDGLQKMVAEVREEHPCSYCGAIATDWSIIISDQKRTLRCRECSVKARQEKLAAMDRGDG